MDNSNGRQTVGDGAAFSLDPSVLAVCQMEGNDDMYYYSTTFSGGPGVSIPFYLPAPITYFYLLSGVFDAPKSKCPPDRGSSHCVTGSVARISIPYSPSSSPENNLSNSAFDYLAAAPRPIPARSSSELNTPPLTPDGGSECSLSGSDFGCDDKDALDFLMTVFPKEGLAALPYAKRVNISAPNLDSDFNGMVLDMPGKSKTLYVDGKSARLVSLRERYIPIILILFCPD